MTAQEKQVTLQNLQIVTGLFQEFEEAYNMVISLPNQKRTALSTPEEMGELFQDTLQHASPLATSLQMFTMGSPLKYTVIVYLAAYFIAIIPAFMAGRLVGMLFGKSAIMTVYMILSIIGTIYIGKFIKKQINNVFCRARRSQPFETSTRKQEALYTTSTRKQEEPYTSNTRLPEVLSRLREKR